MENPSAQDEAVQDEAVHDEVVQSWYIDADGHVLEPDDVWGRHLPADLVAYAPRWGTDSEGRPRRIVGNRMQPYFPFPRYDLEPVAGGADGTARLADMDRAGIDIGVLYPSAGLHFAAVPELSVVESLCRAYNDWLHDLCAVAPRRLRAAAVVPQLDPVRAAVEARRAVNQLGAVAIVLRPNPIGGRTVDDPTFDPLWQAACDLDVPVVFHEATTMNVPQAGLDRTTNYLVLHTITHPHEHQMALLGLIAAGTLERFPSLRVAFMESGCGWVPYWLERIDQHLDYWGHASRPLPRSATDYFARQCFVSPFADEAMLPQVLELLGDENLVYTSDYPYPYVGSERITAALAERGDVADAAKRRLLRTNAERLYRL